MSSRGTVAAAGGRRGRQRGSAGGEGLWGCAKPESTARARDSLPCARSGSAWERRTPGLRASGCRAFACWRVGATRRARCSRPGMAASRSRVYCSCGLSNTSSVVAASTIRPRCMTQTWSAMTRTTARSCVMNRYVSSELGLQVGEQAQDLRLHEHVERGDRLVEHDDLGLQRERTRDRDALALAARELVRVAADERARQRHLVEQLEHPLAARRLACRPCACDSGSAIVLPMLRSGFERAVRVLEDRLHAAAEVEQLLAGHAREVLAVDDDLAARRRPRASAASSRRSTCPSPTRRRAPWWCPWRSGTRRCRPP